MKKDNKKNKISCMIICHGKSEFLLANHFRTTLRIPIIIEADKKGKKSIQINSLKNFLKRRNFKNKTSFENHYSLKIDNKFRVFIIMDTDDCNKQEAVNYINKVMFKNHWLYNYIIPIFNDPNIEKVCDESKLNKMKSKTDVCRIFPDDTIPDKVKSIEHVSKKLGNCNNTNMEKMFDYLLSIQA